MNDGVSLVFFEGENPEALKQEFIRLCAKHKRSRPSYEIAKHVFRDLREPILRAMQAADHWASDLAVQEAIDEAILIGPEDEAGLSRRKRIAMAIAEDPREHARDRIAALEYVSKVSREITKSIDIDVGDKAGRALPIFNLVEREPIS